MSSTRHSGPASGMDKVFNNSGRSRASVDIGRNPQPKIVRQFGNGFQRVRSDNPVKTWSAADDFLRKWLVTAIFLVASAIIALSIYVGHAALSSFSACKRSNEVNSYLYKQTISECVWSKMSDRSNDLPRSLHLTSDR